LASFKSAAEVRSFLAERPDDDFEIVTRDPGRTAVRRARSSEATYVGGV
jgi:hypothetical protein